MCNVRVSAFVLILPLSPQLHLLRSQREVVAEVGGAEGHAGEAEARIRLAA
jgi:hypothetical protein